MDVKEKIKNLPDAPGVYFMKDAAGEVIYVGKAVSLRKRVRSYFTKGEPSVKTAVMLSAVRDIAFIETGSEHDALILESDLIKKYRPHFNISLKDDKSYPYIKITQEDFPRVFIGRRKKGETGFDYFGPYTSARLLRNAVKILRKSFPFCTARRFPLSRKPCLHYHLGLCMGPCAGLVSRKAYRAMIRGLEDFLARKDEDLIEDLSLRMRALVKEEKFEEAARTRDQLEALSLLISLKKFDVRRTRLLEDDWRRLGLKNEPRRIEGFDISNLGGGQSVGSMVSFFDGKPDKGQYRRFRIRDVAGIDDYAMMREVVRRRYSRLLREARPMPDLILIDGGLGHLETALQVLKDLELGIPLISIAKSEELIYTVQSKEPLRLRRDSSVLRLVQRVRDEAHRFAITYHRLLRGKAAFDEKENDGI